MLIGTGIQIWSRRQQGFNKTGAVEQVNRACKLMSLARKRSVPELRAMYVREARLAWRNARAWQAYK